MRRTIRVPTAFCLSPTSSTPGAPGGSAAAAALSSPASCDHRSTCDSMLLIALRPLLPDPIGTGP